MAEAKTIFQYLKEYNLLSNPVTTELGKQLWQHQLDEIPKIKEIWSIYDTLEFDSERILEVIKPRMLSCPQPDEILQSWINCKWSNLLVEEMTHFEEIKKPIENPEEYHGEQQFLAIRFDDDPMRVEAFEEWSQKRKAWYLKEEPKNRGLKLYDKLYRLYNQIQRESESVELVLGDGRLRWNQDSKRFDHPVLLQRVQLHFDADKPSFIISCDEIKTELYTAMLRMFQNANQSLIGKTMEEVEKAGYHIADQNNTASLFKRLANVIDTSGRFVEEFEESTQDLMIKQEPVLILRKRTLGYSMFIEKILEQMNTEEDIEIPSFLDVMIGNYHDELEKNPENSGEHWNASGIDQDVLLTLPANNEQLRIIKYLEHSGAVLVQGPPGTGKTHTIANLIGHLLSQGKSVLVTSHTEKALSVLKEKVYKELQSLCVSVMRGKSQRQEMDATLFEIAEKSSQFDKGINQVKTKKLGKERKELIEEYQKKNQELLKMRAAEYKDLVYDNQTIRPIEAAKFVKEGIDRLDYIPGLTTDSTVGLPLSYDELVELYSSNLKLSVEEEETLHNELPEMSELLIPEQFSQWVKAEQEKQNTLKNWVPVVHLQDRVEVPRVDGLRKAVEKVQNNFLAFDKMQKQIFVHSFQDGIYESLWEKVFGSYDELMGKYEGWRSVFFDHDLAVDERWYTVETNAALSDIIATGKEEPVSGLSVLMKKNWKEIRDGILLDKHLLKKRSDYQAVYQVISYELGRRDLLAKTNKLFQEIESEELILEGFEEQLRDLKPKIESALNWYEQEWNELLKEIAKSVVNEEEFYENWRITERVRIEHTIQSQLNDLLNDFSQYMAYWEYQTFKQQIEAFQANLLVYEDGSRMVKDLLDVIRGKNIKKYELVYADFKHVSEKRQIAERRSELTQKIRAIAPQWAIDIMSRKGIHGQDVVPENIAEAWKWRQLTNQLNRLDECDPNKIQRTIESLNRRLRENAKDLAYEKSWAGMDARQTQEMRQYLYGWRTTMRQIGRGTGKRAPLLMKKAREAMAKCQEAVPVWIMPLNRVVENFDPKKNKFDVIIIDEASQSDVLALSVLYMGKSLIVVGDDQQVSPEGIGQRSDEITALVNQYLPDVPNSHLYNGQSSVYDMALSAGFKPIMLTEHFRCLPEIIEFSNRLAYAGKIKPLRDSSGVMTTPAVVNYRVPEGMKDKRKINSQEAAHIVSLVQACIEDERYKAKTIGIISMAGYQQALEIDRQLQNEIDPKVREERNIQCGTPASFQGDERDIIFLSLVDGPNENGGPIRVVKADGNNGRYSKRYNVAASRAKDQLWVVHSLNPEVDLKPEDIRLELIKHAINPTTTRDEKTLKKAESDFEKRVMKELLAKGYKVIPQWNVGAYRIDMVVESGNNRIALECDGERFHTLDDLPNDLKRQAILERLGWTFIRIRGSAYYRQPKDTMAWVYKELESYEIYPSIELPESVETHHDVLGVIKRRALELRNEGQETEESNTRSKDLTETDNRGEKKTDIHPEQDKDEPKKGKEQKRVLEKMKVKAVKPNFFDQNPKTEIDRMVDQGTLLSILDQAKAKEQPVKESSPSKSPYQKSLRGKTAIVSGVEISSEMKRTSKVKRDKRKPAKRVGGDMEKPKFDFRKK
jgi:very-short-patch-repair endonuclease/cellulose biosynthesis protein BcsQ